MDREPIVPPSMRNILEEKGYTPGLRVGPLLFVAGQVGRTPDLRIVAEPGGAAAFAALLSRRYQPQPGERVGVLVCGGNTAAVDFDRTR